MSAEVVMLTPPDPERLAWYEMNDLGNAERLKARSGGLLLFVRNKGWIAWDGRRWSLEDGERRLGRSGARSRRGCRREPSGRWTRRRRRGRGSPCRPGG